MIPEENHASLIDAIYVCLYLKVDLICQRIFKCTFLNPLLMRDARPMLISVTDLKRYPRIEFPLKFNI